MAQTQVKLKKLDKENAKLSTGIAVGIGGIALVWFVGVGLVLYAIYKLLDKHGGEALKAASRLLL